MRGSLARETEFTEVILDATNRRRRPVRIRVTCTPLVDPGRKEPRGATLLMDEMDSRP
jgi:hypothetical protein